MILMSYTYQALQKQLHYPHRVGEKIAKDTGNEKHEIHNTCINYIFRIVLVLQLLMNLRVK